MIPPEDSAAWSRRLLRAWLILAALTILSVGTALAGQGTSLSLVAVLVALGASFVKARQVLDHFLDLRRARGPWRAFFTGLLLVILGGCLGGYLWEAMGIHT